MTPQEYCEDRAARSGSSFYYSFRFLPQEKRQAITALYAFCREIDDVVDEVQDPGVAEIKLKWWESEIDRLYEGHPQHPVGRALLPAVKAYALEKNKLLALIEGMRMDLHPVLYPTRDSLLHYCHHVAGVVGLLSAQIFGFTDPKTLEYANTLGLAFQMTNIIRDVGEDARRGRVYLPGESMMAHGITAQSIISLQDSPAFRALLRDETAFTRQLYTQALTLLPEADRALQKPGLIMAAIYQTLLDEIEDEDFNVMNQRIALTPLRKLWLAWTTSIGWRR